MSACHQNVFIPIFVDVILRDRKFKLITISVPVEITDEKKIKVSHNHIDST